MLSQTHELFDYVIGALLLLQMLVIGVLLVQNHRQQLAMKDVERLKSEAAHAVRLAMAGEISASIAHEVAQPLSAILSNVETAELLLRQSGGHSRAIGDILADIKRDDLRAYEIVQRLKSLLQKRAMQFESVDVNGLIANSVAMLRTDAMRRCISLRTDFAELPAVPVDRVHFQQVILNLLLNAMDALETTAAAGRSILVRTRVSGRSRIEVVVSDTGAGMTAEQLAHAFDSFFTTKEGGMGLGLSIARSIVQAHGGTITVQSFEHGGTTFCITLPALESKSHLALAARSP